MRKLLTLLVGAALLYANCVAKADNVGTLQRIPGKIASLIESIFPGAQVVQPDEYDVASCKPMSSSLSVIKADLSGNHRDDYAVLVKTKMEKKIIWNGRSLTEAKFTLMMFIDDGHGSYTARKVTSFTDYLPLAVSVQLEPAGKLHDVVSDKDVAIEHPAISVAFCERSTAAYYLSQDQIRSIPLVD